MHAARLLLGRGVHGMSPIVGALGAVVLAVAFILVGRSLGLAEGARREQQYRGRLLAQLRAWEQCRLVLTVHDHPLVNQSLGQLRAMHLFEGNRGGVESPPLTMEFPAYGVELTLLQLPGLSLPESLGVSRAENPGGRTPLAG